MKNVKILGITHLAFAAINLMPVHANALPPMKTDTKAATAKTNQAETDAKNKAELLETFSELYMPTEPSIDAALNNYDAQFIRASKADAASLAIEQKYPGVIENAMKAGKVIVERSLRKAIPDVQLKIITFMDARFNSSEIAKINEFYASNASQITQQQMLKNADNDAITDDILKRAREGDGKLSINNAQVTGALAEASVKSMTKESISATSKFVSTPAGRKFFLNANDLLTIITSNLSDTMNDTAVEVQTAVLTSIQEYTAARP